jgi:[glutamine synthetase] adenylyltransferase / [glutamine synthetase]-adenylyl-L-tyrosine phosphorylase
MTVTNGSLASRIVGPLQPEASAAGLKVFEAAFTADVPASARQLIKLMAATSPYLRDLLLKWQHEVAHMLSAPPEDLFAKICADCRRLPHSRAMEEARRELRFAKSRIALLAAMADLGGVWSVEEVTRHLTEFADAATQSALDFLLLEAAAARKLVLQDESHPSERCGYVALGMGKHGAHELNYSSDIDLIVLYDQVTAPLAEGVEPSTFFVKLTRSLVSLLQDLTEDGYVFRVDLRLRPDPRATQVAIAMDAAAIYYENQGQNWERAAMIKARPIAGDIALGEEFLDRLKPYIWRRYLDFAAIADIQSLKRQIHAVKGHGEIAVLGHNLKLGRGGIREIEFFVQTQQLIAGGRNPALRGRQTLKMLEALAQANWITGSIRDEMAQAYRFLRMLEHRIQMLNDQQDHSMPATEENFATFAPFAGFATAQELKDKLQSTLQTVQTHYQALFESAENLSSDAGNLVFTGGEDDPGTIETLQRMGFREASEISASIRSWHFGRYTATRAARSRELLTELMPKLLKALADTGDADQAFLAFDAFLKGLPAGVQLFSMLKANPRLLELIARLVGTAPRLATQLSRRPRILEAVLEPGFFDSIPKADEINKLSAKNIPDGLPLEDAMDRARVLCRELMFRTGVRLLSETASASEAALAYSNIADAMLCRLHKAVSSEMCQKHGTVPGGVSAAIAMGKLGSREMTAGSDLDLILVYDCAPDSTASDGPRPLSPQQYYSRLTQHLITAITAPTAEGILYEADMRLRPSGSKGPVAVSLRSFVDYQSDSAWTWEKLALTRARVVSAEGELGGKVEAAIKASLSTKRDPAAVTEDVRQMRSLMRREHQANDRWDIKRKPGGLVDIEFIAQNLQLIHAHRWPEVLQPSTEAALQALMRVDALSPDDGNILQTGHTLYSMLTQILRMCLDENFDPSKASRGLSLALCRAVAQPDIASTENLIDENAQAIARVFEKIIGKTDN